MFLGGDQLKNNLGNNVIIKCYECGDTNLRYIDEERTGTVGSGYICGNGHKTWGAIDDWSILGQTDIAGTRVDDCCCESLGCNLPDSIFVDFDGIYGVQAIENCSSQFPGEIISSRTNMPLALCGPCCDVDTGTNANDPWSVTCGCESINGPCQYSDDYAANNYPCFSARQEVYNDFGDLIGHDIHWKYVTNSIPALRIGGQSQEELPYECSVGDCWVSDAGSECFTYVPPVSCVFGTGVDSQYIANGFFEQGWLANFRSSTGPAFVSAVYGTIGQSWSNGGQAIKFLVDFKAAERFADPDSPGSGICVSMKREIKIIARTHPTATPTEAIIGDDWSIRDGGVANPVIIGFCADTDECGFTEPTWDAGFRDPEPSDFCNLSNLSTNCTTCNNAVGEIEYTPCEDDGQGTFWPWRIPEYYTVDGSSRQIILNNPASFPAPDECDSCLLFFNCDNPTYPVPDSCYNKISYPSCLNAGTDKCSDNDAKYRVPCANPTDTFDIKLNEVEFSELLDNRYSLGNIGSDYRAITISFNPIFTFNDSDYYDVWQYAPHPNEQLCGSLSQDGFVNGYGDPGNYTPDWPAQCLGAVGVANARLFQVFPTPGNDIAQPHCTRKVKNPEFDSLYPFYFVNTGDLSLQRLVLDRYFPTSTNNDIQYLWNKYQMGEDGVSQQAFITNEGDKGVSDIINSTVYPYPFVANSGSLARPDLVAIIHSTSGTGGQVAFDLMPMAFDTDVLIEPPIDIQRLYTVDPGKYCPFRQRVRVHGYSVMYPFRDDPIWSETNASGLEVYDYPVILPGQNYNIGDKIEFRCWKTLEDYNTRFIPSGVPIEPGKESGIWDQECVEGVIATATVTMLNDEREAPTSVSQTIPNATIVASSIPENTTRYQETYKLASVSIINTSGYLIGDTINIEFNDQGTLDGIHYDTNPSVTVAATGSNGSIAELTLTEPGEFYKIVRTGGIRWYEFDETSETSDNLIFTGNCPCVADICSSGCNGCVSKTMYPSPSGGHDQLEALVYPRSLVAQTLGDVVASSKDYFPGFPWPLCVTKPECKDLDDNLIPLFCPSSLNSTQDCGDSSSYVARYTSIGTLGWVQKTTCQENCGSYITTTPSSYGETESVDCECTTQSTIYLMGQSLYPVGPWDYRTDACNPSGTCWPLVPTYDFPNKSENYAISACSGAPVAGYIRPSYVSNYVVPPKDSQYTAVWLPNPQAFIANADTYLGHELLDSQRDALIDDWLRLEPCNPVQIDRYGRSYKWPTLPISSNKPCRKFNPGQPLPSGLEETLDDYCRAYGFYQQRQPSCNVLYQGQYILRAAQRSSRQTGQPVVGNCADNQRPGVGYPPPPGYDLASCDPVIADISISLTKLESQFDISVGAPYNQDFLLPELLPSGEIGPDGKLESIIRSWQEPSKIYTPEYAESGMHYYGFYEPNREAGLALKEVPPNNYDSPVFIENPPLLIPDAFDYDVNQPSGKYIADPRTNCYPSGFPDCVNYRTECPYPWENNVPATSTTADFYCMFKNNSAEIVIDEIDGCVECRNENLMWNGEWKYNWGIGTYYSGINGRIPVSGPFRYTSEIILSESVDARNSIIFRAYTNSDRDPTGSIPSDAVAAIIGQYLDVFQTRYSDEDLTITDIFEKDDNYQILSNMLFNGVNENPLLIGYQLSRLEIFNMTVDPAANPSFPPIDSAVLLFEDDRCNAKERSGSIKSLKVNNGGEGYAFEIEERVAPSSIYLTLAGETLTGYEYTASLPKVDNRRRKEKYEVADIVAIRDSGVPVNITIHENDIFTINFDDTDAVRDGIKIIEQPYARVTSIDGDNIELSLVDNGSFYKYIKTGKHAAFPVSMILNNYWDIPGDGQKFGSQARLSPVVGIDPSDPLTYGKIKRVLVEFGGYDYILPGVYWQIDTRTGTYDSYGDLTQGLDLMHLANPSKFKISTPLGLDQYGITALGSWDGMGYFDVLNQQCYDDQLNNYVPCESMFELPNEISPIYPSQDGEGKKYIRSTKNYLYTSVANIDNVRWENKAHSISSVIISGTCPVDASGGLLNRTYPMALREEAYLWPTTGKPLEGICSTSFCNEIIDYDDPSCDGTKTGFWTPGDINGKNCTIDGTACPVMTTYYGDTWPIGGVSDTVTGGEYKIWKKSLGPPAYARGCMEIINNLSDQVRSTFCYGNTGCTEGGTLYNGGYLEYPFYNNPSDRCHSPDHTMYAEFAIWANLESISDPPEGIHRVFSISYSMGGQPIEMRVSYDTEKYPYPNYQCPEGEKEKEVCDCE